MASKAVPASVKRNKFLTEHLLGESNEDFVRCRTLKHAWDPIGAGERSPLFGTLVCLRCVFCGTLRYDKISRITGERIAAPSYDWPEGYRDAERHNAAWWRQQWAENVYGQGLSVDAEDELVTRRRKRA